MKSYEQPIRKEGDTYPADYRRIETEGGRTVASSAEVAGSFAADKRAEGYEVTITPRGSDDKRGTKVWFDIEWHRPIR